MAAVEARKLAGDVVPMDASPAGVGKLALTLRVPIGVVGAISPFNFPFNLVAHKVAPALAAGCAVVLKPASQTPLSALLLAELEDGGRAARRAGSTSSCGPASEIGDVLVEDERVALITFTGSAGVGWKLRERAPRKRVNLELGNATPVIVAADADLDDVAARLAAHAFSFAGPELHLGPADLRRALRVRRVPRALPAPGRGARGRRSGRRRDRRRPAHLAGRPRPRARRGSRRRRRAGAQGPRRRRARRRASAPDRRRRRAAGREGLVRGGLRPAVHRRRRTTRSTRRSPSRTARATGSRRASSRATSRRRSAPRTSSSSAASP